MLTGCTCFIGFSSHILVPVSPGRLMGLNRQAIKAVTRDDYENPKVGGRQNRGNGAACAVSDGRTQLFWLQ